MDILELLFGIGEKISSDKAHEEELSRVKALYDEECRQRAQGQAELSQLRTQQEAELKQHAEEKARLEGLLGNAESETSTLRKDLDDHKARSAACLTELKMLDDTLASKSLWFFNFQLG